MTLTMLTATCGNGGRVTGILWVLCRALDVPLTALYRMYLGSACISEIQWHDREFAAVRRVNDTSHLP